jgi:uncharacterized protein YbbK (DUF523 family)
VTSACLFGVHSFYNGNHRCQFFGGWSAANDPQRLLQFVLEALGAHMFASH